MELQHWVDPSCRDAVVTIRMTNQPSLWTLPGWDHRSPKGIYSIRNDRKSGLSIVLVPLEKGGDHFRTHERHDFHLQRKGVVEAKDVRFPPQSKWIETVGQKIGICEMQCCSDMVIYIWATYDHIHIHIHIHKFGYIYILIYIYVWIFIWFGNAETWLTHLWQIWSFVIQTGTLQSEPPFLRVRLKMSDPPNRMEMMNLSRKKLLVLMRCMIGTATFLWDE